MLVNADTAAPTFNAVVMADEYRLRQHLDCNPDVILDIGANLGWFAMAARVFFPAAHLICVEPVQENYEHLAGMTRLWPRTQTIRAALGRGELFWRMGHGESHSHHQYATPSCLYPWQCLNSGWDLCFLQTMTLAEIAGRRRATRRLIKIDCEGAEDSIVDSPEDNLVLRAAVLVCMELHFSSPDETQRDMAKPRLLDWVGSFADTHEITTDLAGGGGVVWLKRRES